MAVDFVEAFLRLKPGGTASHVRDWLEKQGLTVVPMQAELLLSGSGDTVNRAFDCDVSTLPRPARLKVPKAIDDHVELVEIPRPRYPTSGHSSP